MNRGNLLWENGSNFEGVGKYQATKKLLDIYNQL